MEFLSYSINSICERSEKEMKATPAGGSVRQNDGQRANARAAGAQRKGGPQCEAEVARDEPGGG